MGSGADKEYEDQERRNIGIKPVTSALDVQEGGNHYRTLKIQPVEYIHANNIPFIEGCIIKYVTRWRSKGGLEDLKKVQHFTALLIELEHKNGTNTRSKG